MLMDFSSFLSICLLPALKPSQAIQLGSTLTYPDYATLDFLPCVAFAIFSQCLTPLSDLGSAEL